ncbi:hypothetical protein [Streptomyces pini]|uniref:Uncharacterized protein n=1 Tax=Streptomyces pini TaxID=1520580 RepID=A0A1I4BW04_9ACTN|nr:hypothetical protein [Streptomyces pini]SFK72590.1 hypothetical protein SAMN05192584_108149 [Streptomyces pini]
MTARLPAPSVLTPGLLASLAAHTWLDHTPDSRVYSVLLLTHPPTRNGDPQAVEQRMLATAAALALDTPAARVPDVGERLTVHDRARVLLHLDGCETALRLPFSGHWAHTIGALGRVLLAVGLDPLPPRAHHAAVDRYVDAAARAGRIRVGSCRVADGAGRVPGVAAVAR